MASHRAALMRRAMAERVLRSCWRWCGHSVALLAAWLLLSAHVGTNQVVLEGQAGGYPVRVIIRPPGVVPAQVPIIVRVLRGTPERVTVRAAQWNVGTKGAPQAEPALVVPGETQTYERDLWIMTASAYAVHVRVEGPAGSGTLLVPMQSVATRTLPMPRAIGSVLVVLGALLVLGILTIVGAAAREGTLPQGLTPDIARRRSARAATGVAAAVLALALFGGAKWWQSEAAAYRRGLYKPYRVTTSVREEAGVPTLTLHVDDPAWSSPRNTPIMPDHGRLMHLFLIRENDAGAIAHLHPLRTAFDTFVTEVPPLPAGRYFLFADVVHESGYQRTMVDTVDVAAPPAVPRAAVSKRDAFDAWRVVSPVAPGTPSPLSAGTLTLRMDTLPVAGRDLRLQVTVANADGSPAVLEPYMGMGGHAMVMREDGKVFVHLHPMGTASMAAQAALLRREEGDTTTRAALATDAETDSMPAVASMASTASTEPAGVLAFPFAFPTEGRYRVFVQVKVKGVVETASVAVTVAK